MGTPIAGGMAEKDLLPYLVHVPRDFPPKHTGKTQFFANKRESRAMLPRLKEV
jgi:hypothetical protein